MRHGLSRRYARRIPNGKRIRKEIVFRRLNAAGSGLEIGPCHNALAPKREGYNVKILDHLSSEGLRRKYDGHAGVNTASIEEVDYVWSGQPFADLTDERFDWIIASHVIESYALPHHFINDCARYSGRTAFCCS